VQAPAGFVPVVRQGDTVTGRAAWCGRGEPTSPTYDRGAVGHRALWSPVGLRPALALVRDLEFPGRCVVAVVGAGTGALLAAIRAAAARVLALDASARMLHIAANAR
jgi:2-polyprenyl-3-methyl-5-hydroxy-6-metoxy-1,4-benzoquinol methylase